MVYDLKKYIGGRHTAKYTILSGFKDSDDLRANSPFKRAREFTTPVFLAHGTKDVTVHFDQFKRMKSALKKSPAKRPFVEFPNGDHSLSTNDMRVKLYTVLDKFLRENLGESAAAP